MTSSLTLTQQPSSNKKVTGFDVAPFSTLIGIRFA